MVPEPRLSLPFFWMELGRAKGRIRHMHTPLLVTLGHLRDERDALSPAHLEGRNRSPRLTASEPNSDSFQQPEPTLKCVLNMERLSQDLPAPGVLHVLQWHKILMYSQIQVELHTFRSKRLWKSNTIVTFSSVVGILNEEAIRRKQHFRIICFLEKKFFCHQQFWTLSDLWGIQKDLVYQCNFRNPSIFNTAKWQHLFTGFCSTLFLQTGTLTQKAKFWAIGQKIRKYISMRK